MADLIDRLTGLSEEMIPPRPRITTHEFEAHLILLASDKWTPVEAQIGLDLQGDELTQMQSVLAVLNSKVGTAKIVYGLVVMAVALALAHAPTPGAPTTNVYFSWSGDTLVVDKARVALDLEIQFINGNINSYYTCCT